MASNRVLFLNGLPQRLALYCVIEYKASGEPHCKRPLWSIFTPVWDGIALPAARGWQIFERAIQTSKGPVDILAEVVVQGDKLALKDIATYGRGIEPLTGLSRDFLSALSQLKAEAKALGFKQLQIIGQRVSTSTSANPGHAIDVTVNIR